MRPLTEITRTIPMTLTHQVLTVISDLFSACIILNVIDKLEKEICWKQDKLISPIDAARKQTDVLRTVALDCFRKELEVLANENPCTDYKDCNCLDFLDKIMNTTSPKSSLVKLGLHSKQKPLKIMVLGQSGVGKTAMVVRFITRRFIGEYDPNLEKIYTFSTVIDNELVSFEILDAAGQPNETECVGLEANIRWADAFILMYSVTDKCSFDECNRLKFLINYNKRRRKLGSNSKDGMSDVPVLLVGNKTDQWGDRMVSLEEGQKRFREISCVCFHEISVRESVEQVWSVFRDVCRFWRVFNKFPKLKRSTSDVQNSTDSVLSPDSGCSFYEPNLECEARRSFLIIGHPCAEEQDPSESTDEMGSSSSCSSRSEIDPPFRGRASTDGTLLSRPRRWRYPPPGCVSPHSNRVERRMSISTRGSNASY